MKKIVKRGKKTKNIGKIDRGAIFVVVFLITAITLSYLMVGGTLPTKVPTQYNNNLVQVPPFLPGPTKNSLQMMTFLGATLTPYPTPPPFQNTASQSGVPAELADCGHVPAQPFDQSIFWAYQINGTQSTGNALALKIFYVNKTALILGTGAISPMNTQPSAHIILPNVGPLTAKDAIGLPYPPSVYVTDITTAPNAQTGDAENAGEPHIPDEIYGQWISTTDPEPSAMNGTTFGSFDPLPPANNPYGAGNTDTSAELIWRITSLTANNQPLQPNHQYRFEVILHGDKDQVGEICINSQLPADALPGVQQPSTFPLPTRWP